MVAMSVQRWRGVMPRAVSQRSPGCRARSGVDSPPCPDPWRSSAPVSSSPRWPSSIAACSRRPAVPRPRVAILPTASAPDGEEVFSRWAEMGVEHFGALGAEVEPVLVRDRGRGPTTPRPLQAIGEADLDLPLGRQARAPAARPRASRRWARRWPRPTRAGRSSPGARPGRWSSSGGRGLPLPAQVRLPCRARSAGRHGLGARRRGVGRCPTTTRGPSRSRRSSPSRRRAARVVLGIDEETARRRPRRRVAGPRPRPGDGLARPPPRALPRRATRSGSEAAGGRTAGPRSVRADLSGSSPSSRPGWSMRGLNGTCAWLPHDEQIDDEVLARSAVVAALVAARAADVADVVAAAIAGGAPAGAAAACSASGR